MSYQLQFTVTFGKLCTCLIVWIKQVLLHNYILSLVQGDRYNVIIATVIPF